MKHPLKDEDDEIEITPEMIEAGELAFSEYDPRFEGPRDLVIRVFTRMKAGKS